MQVLSNLDLAKNELQNARIQNLASHPANPVAGLIYFNTNDKTYYGWDGTVWRDLGKSYEKATTAMDGLMSKEDKAKLDGIEAGANKYVHPTTAGNKHIPTGGASGQVLKYGGSSGTAAWGALTASEIPTLTLSKISDAGTAASKNVGTAAGDVPVLGSGGKLDPSVIPAVAISETFVVASEAAMLALNAQTGDVAIRSDISKSFILTAEPASTLSNWQELLTPESPVQSVNGKVGIVVLSKSDVGLGNVKNVEQTTKYSTNIGNGSATEITVTHNLGTQDLAVTVRRNAAPYDVVYPDIEVTNANSIKLLFAVAPTSNQYRVTVIG